LKAYRWPGNVRELQSVIKHALLEATGPVLVPAFLPASVRAENNDGAATSTAAAAGLQASTADTQDSHDVTNWSDFIAEQIQSGSEAIYQNAQRLMERQIIPRILQQAEGNQQHASKLLGMSRTTLRSKCRDHGITIDKVVDSGE
jgi:DNA-binding NtrC family response regulator